MRNVFYFLAALLAFGAAYYYYQDVSAQTATVNKLRLVARDGLVIEAGTEIDAEFMQQHVVSQPIPLSLAGQFQWALGDNAATRINLEGRVFGRDVASGSFLQRDFFFVPQEQAFARRIRPGNRAISIPLESDRAVSNFITPGSRVDLISAFFDPDTETMTSRLLMENVEVMAVGEIDSRGEFVERNRPEYDNVTLQAPAGVVAAFLAMEEIATGDLTLVLRNPCEDPTDCEGEATQ